MFPAVTPGDKWAVTFRIHLGKPQKNFKFRDLLWGTAYRCIKRAAWINTEGEIIKKSVISESCYPPPKDQGTVSRTGGPTSCWLWRCQWCCCYCHNHWPHSSQSHLTWRGASAHGKKHRRSRKVFLLDMPGKKKERTPNSMPPCTYRLSSEASLWWRQVVQARWQGVHRGQKWTQKNGAGEKTKFKSTHDAHSGSWLELLCVLCVPVLVIKSCPTLVIPWTMPARLLCPWDSPGKNTGVGCHFLLQGIFPTQESNLGLLHCRQKIYQLSYVTTTNKFKNQLGYFTNYVSLSRYLTSLRISFPRSKLGDSNTSQVITEGLNVISSMEVLTIEPGI